MGIRARAAGVGLVIAALAAAFSSHEAIAKTQYGSRYGYDKTWNAAVRLVRVDLGFKVLEKDEANGYLLFEYRSNEGGPKATSGSVEIIKPSGKVEDVLVVVQLPQMPRYHEQVLVDQLARKMHDEYGDPPPRKKDAPPPPPDAGPDGGEDESSSSY
jgi:hypothetical protein